MAMDETNASSMTLHFEAIEANTLPPTLPLLKEEVFLLHHEAKLTVSQWESFS